MRFIKNRFLKVILIILPVLIVVLGVMGGNNPLQKAVYSIMTPISSKLSFVIPLKQDVFISTAIPF